MGRFGYVMESIGDIGLDQSSNRAGAEQRPTLYRGGSSVDSVVRYLKSLARHQEKKEQ